MKTMTVGEFKTHFSEVIDQVKSGEKIEVTFGKTKEIVGYFIPEKELNVSKRRLGLLEGKATVHFGPDFEMTEEEFLGL